jgi:hypothetical protein
MAGIGNPTKHLPQALSESLARFQPFSTNASIQNDEPKDNPRYSKFLATGEAVAGDSPDTSYTLRPFDIKPRSAASAG